jgi:hypothetical protein
MPKEPKQFKINISHTKRGDRIVEGTLEYLIGYFGYTLEIGNSWNRKINRTPKTIKSFVTNLQKAFEEKEASCYERTFVDLVS